jgi:NADPH-dependent F420 reductase
MSAAVHAQIAILGGTGNLGRGLALRWASAGHPIMIGSRSRDKAIQVAVDINGAVGRDAATGCSLREAASAASIIALTVPYSAQRASVEEVRDLLQDKILIDTTVPLVPPKVARVQLPAQGSAVAAIQEMLGPSVRVVSAFQNVSAHLLRDLNSEIDCDVLICGDDPAARETVVELVTAIGLRGVQAGPVANSAAAEALTSLLISINARYKVEGAGIRITGL